MGFRRRQREAVSVRTFEEADRGACRALWIELTAWHRRLYDDPTAGGAGDLAAELDAHLERVGRERVFVAELRGRVVGFAALIPGEQPELEPIVVEPGARGAGVGQALVAAVFAFARASGIRRLVVRPVARNASALRFFERVGFRTLGQVELFAWPAGSAPWGQPSATLCGVNFDG